MIVVVIVSTPHDLITI